MAIERCCVPTCSTRLCRRTASTSARPSRTYKRQRLFGVDILAGLAGVNAGQHALKFAGGHDHRVDILAIEQLAIVLIDGPVAFLLGLEGFGPRQVAIGRAPRSGPHSGNCSSSNAGPAADADRADANSIVRSWLVRRGQDFARNEQGAPRPAGGDRGGRSEKLDVDRREPISDGSCA